MKSIKLYTFLIIALMFTACNNDDNNETAEIPLSESIIGTWELTGLESTTNLTSEASGIPVNSNIDGTGSNFNYTITLTEDSYTVNGAYDITVNVSLAGIPVQETTETIDQDLNGMYTLENDRLFLDDNLFSNVLDMLEELDLEGLEEGIEITINTDGELVLTQDLTISSEGIELIPFPFEGTSSSELVFVRQ